MKKFAFIILLPTLLSFGLVIPNTINEKTNLMPNTSLNMGNLTDIFEGQINIFSNETLWLLDDIENAVQAELEIPNVNLLNVFTDLDEIVTFQLYTKESGDEFHILGFNDTTALKEFNFSTKRDTYIITHGFMSACDGLSCTLVRNALQNTTDSNIITVNWSHSSIGSYEVARAFVEPIGIYTGKLINFLYENGMNSSATTLIGHSLGAHIMGFAGQTVHKKVNHIIGLDPAWPLFASIPENSRLSRDDADHVQVIHTNAGLWGYPFDMGHYDFYPNEGTIQPGCPPDFVYICSHGRSYLYLVEQISNPGPDFCSLKCTSFSEFTEKKCTKEIAFMGDINSYPANPGTYYLVTNDKEPFSLTTQCA